MKSYDAKFDIHSDIVEPGSVIDVELECCLHGELDNGSHQVKACRQGGIAKYNSLQKPARLDPCLSVPPRRMLNECKLDHPHH